MILKISDLEGIEIGGTNINNMSYEGDTIFKQSKKTLNVVVIKTKNRRGFFRCEEEATYYLYINL